MNGIQRTACQTALDAARPACQTSSMATMMTLAAIEAELEAYLLWLSTPRETVENPSDGPWESDAPGKDPEALDGCSGGGRASGKARRKRAAAAAALATAGAAGGVGGGFRLRAACSAWGCWGQFTTGRWGADPDCVECRGSGLVTRAPAETVNTATDTCGSCKGSGVEGGGRKGGPRCRDCGGKGYRHVLSAAPVGFSPPQVYGSRQDDLPNCMQLANGVLSEINGASASAYARIYYGPAGVRMRSVYADGAFILSLPYTAMGRALLTLMGVGTRLAATDPERVLSMWNNSSTLRRAALTGLARQDGFRLTYSLQGVILAAANTYLERVGRAR